MVAEGDGMSAADVLVGSFAAGVFLTLLGDLLARIFRSSERVGA